mmetsp:Transcript_18735/g.25352  ORF Transcript_18735/g.25352 Transcript_18735/m.25352 type:complete len:101 (-) Transcript_18735:159-461(-)|eukprot:CAMPEP_0185591900 /NCGR_PEP_ID=MMETSP0434-20130131/66193_1 /TAXON_ID=626734 ORGANISM="Favella taraikaensis, Strain Fe Narragansett Bay" /NCGR_SAMPLE_ID=MMETSP0434 /ASSEMBLY_ACC=CAM_ASM_000379 /LENGTH=100 /DNA_ID=CAMNT_0028217309 /DNA_START=833 /DNA_END=1135 /DNA_ORIENTATION=-
MTEEMSKVVLGAVLTPITLIIFIIRLCLFAAAEKSFIKEQPRSIERRSRSIAESYAGERSEQSPAVVAQRALNSNSIAPEREADQEQAEITDHDQEPAVG